MSEKTAKVVEVLQKRKWEGPNGTVYYYKLELDNGEIGEIGKKKDNAVHVGETLTYTSEQTDYGLKFKAVPANGFGGGFKGAKSSGSPASFALSYAKDIMVASMPFHQDVKVSDWIDVTIAAANKFHAFLKERE